VIYYNGVEQQINRRTQKLTVRLFRLNDKEFEQLAESTCLNNDVCLAVVISEDGMINVIL